MANSNRVTLDGLGDAIAETLTIYSRDVEDGIERVTKKSMSDLVKQTKATAPVGRRGSFAKSIASKKLNMRRGSKYVWYAKPPDHRLTHLLVHGHATKDGGRTKGNPFLTNALDKVLPQYEHDLEEVLKNGGN